MVETSDQEENPTPDAPEATAPAAGASEAPEATGASEATEATGASEATEATEASEATEATEATGASEASEATGASEAPEATEVAEAPGVDESPEAAAPEPPATDWKAEHDKVKSQTLRLAADFDNYRKRVQRDLRDAAHRARDEVLQELLPVIDNLERAVEHAGDGGGSVDSGSLMEGVHLVLRQFEASMERFEVRGFSALGEPFDPAVHEAMQQRETDEAAPGTVVEEFRKGYMMGERLVRPAMVVVAAAPAASTAAAVDPEGQRDEGDSEAPEAEGAPASTGEDA